MLRYVKWPLAVLAAAAVTAGIFYVSGLGWGVPSAPRIHGEKGASYFMNPYAPNRLNKNVALQGSQPVIGFRQKARFASLVV